MDVRRGVDIEVKIATKRPSLKFDLLKELERQLKNLSSLEAGTNCSECGRKERPEMLKVKPAYPCDSWDGKSHTCWVDRNIGDTVTFVLAFNKGYNPTVQWRQNFHTLHSGKSKYYIIDTENPLWNIVVGSKGHELRLSPITEIDIDDNSFSAHVIDRKVPPIPVLHFRIRIMPVDQGFVYPGETLIMNMKRISLPPTSMTFKWYLENDGESSTLPSNMKLSPSGGILTISELRKEQEGILTCAVYTNLGLFATKQRFLIKEMNQTGNMLLFVPTRPTHFNEYRKRKKRQIDSGDDYEDTNVEKTETPRPQDVTYDTPNDDTEVEGEDKLAIDKIDVYGKNNEDADAEVSAFRKELVEHAQSSNPNDDQKQKLTKHTTLGTANPENYQQRDETDIFLEVQRKPTSAKTQAQEEFSKLISRCKVSFQCSVDAHCISMHFCKCNSGFQGNGIFCWEVRREELQ